METKKGVHMKEATIRLVDDTNSKKKTKDEDEKKARPSASRLTDEILFIAKKSRDPYNPDNARVGRVLLGQFLKELTADKNKLGERVNKGKHTLIAKSLQEALKEKRALFLDKEKAKVLANAAIRYGIAFGKIKP